jgi:hypothetical protein
VARAYGFLLTVAVMALAAPAAADPRLDEVVYSPYVENHVFEVETRLGQEFGPGDLQGARTLVVEGEYGLNDRVSLALVGHVEREPGVPDRLTSLGVEGIVYVGQVPKVGIDVGGYLEYGKGLAGESDAVEAKLLLAKTSGRFQGLFNLIAEEPIGAPKGEDFASYGYAASATWRTVGNLRLGAQAFGDLGTDHGFLSGPQGAYLGPQLKWEGRPAASVPVEFGIDAGWLWPIGPAGREAQSQLKVNFEVEKRF